MTAATSAHRRAPVQDDPASRRTTELPPTDLDTAARAFCEALERVTRPEMSSLGRAAEPAELYELLVSAAWDSTSVLSLDIFDTALVRKAKAPRDVFLWLHDLDPFRALGLDQGTVMQRRLDAERAARLQALKDRRTAEVPLHDIYTHFAKLTGAPQSTVAAMVETEENVERALAVAHPVIQALYQRAHAAGKRVVFVSDTFHTAAFLRELLQRIGYDHPDDLVVSSADEGKSKGAGTLFPVVIDRLGVPANAILHVGDHPESDHTSPASLGICAVWHPFAGTRDADDTSLTRDDSLASGIAAIGARCLHPPPSFWWRFGFSAAGPLLVGFAEWLHTRLRADGIDRAYFLLRDGEILKRVYDVMMAGRTDAVPSALLESSRRAFMLPAIPAGVGAITSQLFVSENPRPVGEFLTRIGMRIDDLGPAFRAAGFAGFGDVLSMQNKGDVNRLSRLFSTPQVAQRLHDRSSAERADLMAYMRQERVFDGGRVAFVDIGWNGSIQKALVHTCRIERQALDLVGYYLGTFPGAREDAAGVTMHGYACELGLPAAQARPLLEFRQLIELICTSARGSLLHFKRDGACVRPVTGPIDHDAGQLDVVRQMHDGAISYAEWFRDEASVFGVTDIAAETALRGFRRVVVSPTPDEAARIGALTHGDGMGASKSRTFAQFTDGQITPDQLLKDYRHAYWKEGMTAQHNAHALALRSLLFLTRRQ